MNGNSHYYHATRANAKRDFAWPIGVIVAGICLGLAVALLPETSVPSLLGPLALLVVVIIWAMPAPRSVPSTLAWYLIFCVVALTDIWPSYISLRLPGLPWLSLPRIVMTGFLVVWMYCALNSRKMQAMLADDIRSDQIGFLLLIGFVIMMAASILVSDDKSESTTKVLNYILMSLFAFFGIVSLAGTSRKLTLLAVAIPLCALFEMIIGLREARYEHPFWIDFVPPGFGADEQFIAGLMEGARREDEYRVQGHFFVSLSYAECLVLSLPFAMHWVVEARQLMVKALFFGIILLSFPAIYVSHSRLGMVGFFLGGLTYAALFSLRLWRRSPRSTLAPVLLLLYPLALMGFLGALSVSNHLQDMIIGGGETQASDDARNLQLRISIPKIAESPVLGYGVAEGGAAAGYASENGHETFDNGILLVGLETGVPGLLCFLGFVLWVIVESGRLYLFGKTDVSKLAAAICVAFVVYLVTRWVLAQQENNQLVMVIAGMLICVKRIERYAINHNEEAIYPIAQYPKRGSGESVMVQSFSPGPPAKCVSDNAPT